MKIDIIYGTDVFVLPRSEVMKKLDTAEIIDLKLLLLLSSDESVRNDFNTDVAAKQLKCTRGYIEASLRFWVGADVLKSTDIKGAPSAKAENKKPLRDSNERPNYTGKEIGSIIENTENLRWLIDECQNIVGKALNSADINKIVGMADYLRLEHEHILMLFMYCRNQGKVAVPYVEKFAFNLYEEGIDTLSKFELYVKSREEYTDVLSKMRKLFGIGDRTIVGKENEFFTRWCLEWQFAYDLIQRAYEITIANTDNHKLSYSYMNKVLENWKNDGYTTLAEVDAALASKQQDREKSAQLDSSFDTDEFFEQAVKRTYEKIEKNKEV